MAVSSPQIQDLEYLYASNANVSNFVSEKLSGRHNYHRWKTQMLCLMETHDMRGLVDDAFIDGPRALSERTKKQYDSLLKGWIFGSLSEGVFDTVVDLGSAKDVWDKLKENLCSGRDVQPTMSSQQEIETEFEDTMEAGKLHTISEEAETMTQEKKEAKTERIRMLLRATVQGSWRTVKEILEKDKDALKDKECYMYFGRKTLLHVAVIFGHNDIVEKLLLFIKKEDVKEILERQNSVGETALHVAVRVGNKHAMKLLVDKHKGHLTILDKKDRDPLIIAFDDMQFDTFAYLLKAAVDSKKSEGLVMAQGQEKGASLLVNAIIAKQYSTALDIIKAFPKFAVENDQVLIAMARNFPSDLNYWEILIYPSTFRDIWWEVRWYLSEYGEPWEESKNAMRGHGHLVLRVPVFAFFWVRDLIMFLVRVVQMALHLPYLLLWKVLERLVPRIKHIEKKRKVFKNAIDALLSVCREIRKLDFDNRQQNFYDGTILEASIQNAYEVFLAIFESPGESFKSKNKNGYDIFQLAVINRSEKIYNTLCTYGEYKNRHRTIKDSSESNMLHLAARLAPSHVLKRRTGAALQLQRELQWFEELKEFMHPSYITEQNIYGETPPEVFTREHENLVKEGEKWIKTTAESCSISAALITTIVFAAAITVPGGSNQETGMPMFRKDIAFTIFAISDAISLFTSTSSLMVFLSILTARFAEKDFLVSLPRQLIIGLCTLLLSITAMMVAFGSTLYLLFSRERQWMIGPICGFSCLPILFFVTLQFPLIADLYRSTYVPIFQKGPLNSFDIQEIYERFFQLK